MKDTVQIAQERYEWIRECFLQCLRETGQSRMNLYSTPKPGDAREPTEDELVRRLAGRLDVSLEDIRTGIYRAFGAAVHRGNLVTSFRYCMPQIQTTLAEKRNMAGCGPQLPVGAGVKKEVLERAKNYLGVKKS
jgi:hypothetical protein